MPKRRRDADLKFQELIKKRRRNPLSVSVIAPSEAQASMCMMFPGVIVCFLRSRFFVLRFLDVQFIQFVFLC